jgi:hypothetical protein
VEGPEGWETFDMSVVLSVTSPGGELGPCNGCFCVGKFLGPKLSVSARF